MEGQQGNEDNLCQHRAGLDANLWVSMPASTVKLQCRVARLSTPVLQMYEYAVN